MIWFSSVRQCKLQNNVAKLRKSENHKTLSWHSIPQAIFITKRWKLKFDYSSSLIKCSYLPDYLIWQWFLWMWSYLSSYIFMFLKMNKIIWIQVCTYFTFCAVAVQTIKSYEQIFYNDKYTHLNKNSLWKF